MRDKRPVSPEELSAYVDGELDGERSAEISWLLTTEQELSREAAIHRALSDGMQSLTASEALTPASPALRKAITNLRDRHGRRRWIGIAAGLAVCGVIGALLWMDGGRVQHEGAQDIVENTLYFIDQGRAGVESGSDAKALIARTLPGLHRAALNSTRVASEGFVLEGGRLMAVDGAGAVLLIYRDAQGRPLGLLVSENAPIASSAPHSGTAQIIVWRQGDHRFALIGRQRRATLDAFQAALLAR